MRDEGGGMKAGLLKLNSHTFILHRASFILALQLT